ncbi:TldD/PmbA family protein [candidate division WOR-3 bacterium]|uniref:TldD/PmbA family protein n=1 Tax=candidate division WOR-3 bacterium TaxID=2052148 RepID=A0A660SKQ4_UNCW3|nr:MAG: TldD/PmbA family protein [candidate division WOR-3 bacterium]
MDERLQIGLDSIPKDVTYADLRLVEIDKEEIRIKNGKVEGINRNYDSGLGIRCLARGAWGFAATSSPDRDAIATTVRTAASVARASSRTKTSDVRLAEKEPIKGSFQTEYEKDPFKISLEEKIDYLLRCDEKLRSVKGVSISEGWVECWRERKHYLDTEGSDIVQEFVGVWFGVRATAIDGNELQFRTYPPFHGQGLNRGYELIEEMDPLSHCERIGEEAVALIRARPCPAEVTDLILTPPLVGIFIHESVGHPTELDRVFGTEANFAGTSHLTVEKLNKFRFASELVTIVADATIPGGLGSFWFDDEGVKAQRSELIKDGIFVGYLTSRETAKVLNQASNGTMRAQRWCHIPLIRMTNINLEPKEGTLDQIIGDTQGYLLDGFKSVSIDDQRLNFNLGAEIGWRIDHGRKVEVIKNPVIFGITYDFWRNCDFVGGKESWVLYGIPSCGKGEPVQLMKVGHGAPPIRLVKVRLGV